MTGFRGAVALALLLCASACDNSPNKDFSKEMKSRDANSGDPYAELESGMPRQQSYSRQRPGQERDYAANQSTVFRPVYDGIISEYRARSDVDRAAPFFNACMTAFRDASGYQANAGKSSTDDGAKLSQVLTALKSCRNAAKAKGKKDKALERFSDAGMVMIGAVVVGRGETQQGLAIWAEGEKFAAEDRPKLSVGLSGITTQ